MAANLCSKRVPASSTAWADTSSVWRQVHEEKLQALAHARADIEAALNSQGPRPSPLNWQNYAMFRVQAVSTVMYALAASDDSQAALWCDSLRADFVDRRKADQSFEQAQSAAAAALAALAPPPRLDEALRVWPGDDLAKLQAAYPGSPAPVAFHSGDPASQQSLWMEDRGLRFFLTSGGTINVVRLERPFAGTVNRVRLGDPIDEVRRNLGMPGRDLGAGPHVAPANSYVFETNARYRIRVDLDANQRVQTIFVFR